jgi:hypothetical protein
MADIDKGIVCTSIGLGFPKTSLKRRTFMGVLN